MEKEQLIKFLERAIKLTKKIKTNDYLEEAKQDHLVGYLEGGLEGIKNQK